MTETERQKALIAQYKKTPKKMGVYCIRNLSEGRCLVASSRDLTARFNRHRMELKMRADRSSAELQADWLRLGADAFSIEVLEELLPLDEPSYDPGDDLKELQSLWIEKLGSAAPSGYN